MMIVSSKGNPYHRPAGSPKGGQFCAKGVNGSVLVQYDDEHYEFQTESRKLEQEGEYQEGLLQEAYDNEDYMHGVDLEEHCEYVSNVIAHLIADGMETNVTLVDEYGEYLEERRKKQNEIIDEIFANTKAKKEHKAIVTGGLGGSGKTTVLKRYMHIDTESYITVNPDDVKEIMAEKGMIPNIKGLTPMEASSLVHEETSYISRKILHRASHEGYNIIIDTTLAGESSSREKIGILKKSGYNDIQPVFVDIPPDISLERANARHLHGLNDMLEHHKGYGGRYLPTTMTKKATPTDKKYYSKNAENCIRLYEDGIFTREPVIYNNAGRQPVKIDYKDFVENGKNAKGE